MGADTVSASDPYVDFFENAAAAMHLVGADGTILRANQAELDLLGYTPREYLGHNIAEFHVDAAVIADILARLRRGETLVDYPARLRRGDGTVRSVVISSSALIEDGEFVHTRCVTRDITGERKTNHLLAAQYSVSALLNEALSIDDVGGKVLASVGEWLGWQAAALWLLTGDALRARAVWAADAETARPLADATRATPMAMGVGLPGRVWAQNGPEWVIDFATAGLPRSRAAAAAGLHGAFAVPIRSDRFYGVLECFARERLEPDSATLRAMEHTGRQLGGFLHRLRREADAAHLSAIVASSDDAIASKDLDGTVLSWNPAAERMFGYQADEIIGRSIRLIIPADRQQEEDEVLARIRRGERVDHFQTVRRRKDGTLIDISLTVSPIRDGPGRITGASKVARDITPQKRAEAALRHSQERQRALIAAIPMKLGICGPDRRTVYVNDQMLEYLGCSPETITADGLSPFVHPEDLPRVHEAMARMPGPGEPPLSVELRYRQADGAYHWHLSSCAAFPGPQGEDGWIVVAADIQAIKEAEEVLQRTIAAKDEFLGLVSHELRTPLTQILGNAEVVARFQEAADPVAVGECLREIHREAKRLNRLVENMLLVSRLERGGRMETEPQLVQRLIVPMAAEFRRQFPYVALREEVADDLPPVAADDVSFQQVLWNLLTNAAKYAAGTGDIVLRAALEDGAVVVTVSDRGPGVAEDERERIFDPYFRSRNVSPAAAGLGLGLSVCRRLIEAQDGRMWGKPRPGGGMEFGFALPALEE